jgi:lysophospholipase L1-like esterase
MESFMRRILPAGLVLLTVLAGCASEPASVLSSLPDAASVLALGDSYTAGTAINDGEAWPHGVAAALSDGGTQVELTVVAGEGCNTKRLDREIDQAGISGTYDLVFLAIGANDVILKFGVENYREGLAALAADVERFAGPDGTIVVMSIPDFRAAPWGQARIERGYDIEGYNRILRDLASDLGALFIDITTVSSQAAGVARLIAVDGVHFSDVMHEQWVDLIVEALATAPS